MKKLFIATSYLLLVCTAVARAQTNIRGTVLDDKGELVKGIAVSLLQPQDSTLAFFGISNPQGAFEIRNTSSGTYILQAGGMGYETYYSPLTLPLAAGAALPAIVLKNVATTALDGVIVRSEKIPIVFKKDTIEYNAGSFKTKPDAVVEDLLRKIPGVEVDKAGNIKAQGKEVQKVLVDGKDFFGDDAKVATKNLPADAIDKVQVFDGLSDGAQFTGIDDGSRDKTINLKLKADKRRGYFGDVEGGGGTDSRYKAAAHLYRFKEKSQLAMLGMINNINQFGFSFQDYLSFKGGLAGLMSETNNGGGSNGLQMSGHTPVNFGQAEPGMITSGAAGINYTYEPRPGRRFNISYLGDGVGKSLEQQTDSRNFTDTQTFYRAEHLADDDRSFDHRIYANLRHDIDSSSQLRARIDASYGTDRSDQMLLSASTIRDIVLNRLDSRLLTAASGYSGNTTLSWLKRYTGSWPVLKVSLSGGLDRSAAKNVWDNVTSYPLISLVADDNEYQHNDRAKHHYSGVASITRSLSANNYLDLETQAGSDFDGLARRQGLAAHEALPIDSLSLDFGRSYTWLRPGISFRHSTKKVQYNIALRAEDGWLQTTPEATPTRNYPYLLPAAFWQYTPGGGVMVNATYNTAVRAPAALEMLPLTDYSNSVARIHGNPLLAPEYKHTAALSWSHFDQFSFTSFMAGLQGTYTHDKVNLSRRVNPDLTEDIYYRNVPDDYNLSARGSYSTPLRRLGLNLRLSLNEQYSRSMSTVNDVANTNNSFTHSAKLGLSNRRQEVWSADVSVAADRTDSRYSVQGALNTAFLHYNVSGEAGYKPSDHFYLLLSADVDRYTSSGFADAVTVPLLKASASYYFLKARRGVLTVDGFDLLDQNKNVRRISQLNYLFEQRSNIIGRYFLLAFKYRLSKAGGGAGVKVKML